MSRGLLGAALVIALAVGISPSVATPAPPPVPTIYLHPANPSKFSDAELKFSEDPDPQLTFNCKLDDRAVEPCERDSSVSYSGLLDGSHTFTVTAISPSMEESTASYTWVIDTQPPVLTITKKPPDPSGATTAHFEFSASDLTSVTFKCSLDGGAFQPCSTPPGEDYSNLANGTHTFTLRGTDVLDHVSDTSYSWLVDSTRPVATIDLASTPASPTNRTSASFRFSSNKSGSTFQCRLDDGSFSTCSSPATYGPLVEGTHAFSVRAKDSLGHTGPTARFSWRIDLTPPPAPSIDGKPPDPTGELNASFAFSDRETGVAFVCQLDGGALVRCTSPASYSGLASRAHTFSVRATDAAGNASAAASYGWTVQDTLAPGNVSRIRRSVGYGLLKLAWKRPPDPDFKHVRVFVSKGQKGAKARRKTLVYSGTSTHYTKKRFDNGTYHRYTIVTYDVAGNASRGVSVAVPPSVLLRRPQLGVVVHVPPRLIWTGVRGASFYNVQLYRAGRKILSAWPNAPRLALKRRWSYASHSFRLRKGTYSWFVWPAFGPRAKSRYGRVLGWSQFTVR